MKKRALFLIFAFTTFSLFGQVKDSEKRDMAASKGSAADGKQEKAEDVVDNKPVFQRFDNMIVPDERYEGVKGSRYFYDNKYHEGALVMTKNRTLGKGMLFRFDQLEGTVQMKYPDGKEILVDQNEVLNFDLFVEDKSVVFIRMRTPNKDAVSLVQVIYYSPTLQLVREVRKKLVRVENVGAYSSNTIYDNYKEDYHYFVKLGKNELVEVKPTAKSLSKAMPTKEVKIQSLFKAENAKGELTVSKLAGIIKKLDESPKTEKTDGN